jgi:hypothetical protein
MTETQLNKKLIYEAALAIYTVEYLDKHQDEWMDPNLSPGAQMELEDRMTDPVYIKGRFDAHQGTVRHDQIIKQAEIVVKIVLDVIAPRFHSPDSVL